MDGLIVIGCLVAFAALAYAARPSATSGMEDTPVSIENIRRGVKNGWYSCTLLVVDGIPAVRLAGKTRDGKIYSDIYPITPEDWKALQAEGYKVEKK